eukprot:Platyproteum_vivax@DN6225_c0_g1_i6.p2
MLNGVLLGATGAVLTPLHCRALEVPRALPESPEAYVAELTELDFRLLLFPGLMVEACRVLLEFSVKPLEPRALEANPLEPSVLEANPLEPRVLEAKPLEPSVLEAKPLEPSVLEAKPLEPSVLEAKPL